jgi:hypothetical protein
VANHSTELIHKLTFHNSNNNNWVLLYFEKSICSCSDCYFNSLDGNAISLDHKSQLSLEKSHFAYSHYPPIAISHQSIAEIVTVQIRNSQTGGIVVQNGSKLNIQNSILENFEFGIWSQYNSEVRR